MTLNVSVFLDSITVPRWQERMIYDLMAEDALSIRVHVADEPAAPPRGGWLHRLFERLDARLFRQKNDAWEPVVLEPPGRRDDTPDPDVALWLRAGPVPGDLAARFGVWTFRFGGGDEPPGFWEVMRREATTYSALVNATDKTVLVESWAPVDRVSVHRSRHNFAWKTARFPARALRALACDGALPQAPQPEPERDRRGHPGSIHTFFLLCRHTWRYLLSKIDFWRGAPQWYIGFTRAGGVPFERLTMEGALFPPSDRFWADPFVIARDNRHWVFVEALPFQTQRGYLSVLEVDEHGEVVSDTKILDTGSHLSYPFVFEWEGGLWMVPESSARGCVALYRCERFPDRWVEDSVLLDNVNAVDATLYERDGHWWMFLNIAPPGVLFNWDELHLFRADSPRGPWTPHRGNPVVSDCRRARPAGRLIERDGVLYRPAQNCTPQYGKSTVIHRVDTLTLDDYAETQVAAFRADRVGARRTHTLNFAGDFAVVDLLRRRK